MTHGVASAFLPFKASRSSGMSGCVGFCPVKPVEINRKPFAGQKLHHFDQWQANHVGVRPNDFLNKRACDALDRVTASLAAPFTARKIAVDLFTAEALET